MFWLCFVHVKVTEWTSGVNDGHVQLRGYTVIRKNAVHGVARPRFRSFCSHRDEHRQLDDAAYGYLETVSVSRHVPTLVEHYEPHDANVI